MKTAESDRRGDHQTAARAGALGLRRIFGLLDIGKNATRAFQITCADIGQRDLPGGPLQQPRA